MILNLDFRLSNQKLLVTSFIKVRKEESSFIVSKIFAKKLKISVKHQAQISSSVGTFLSEITLPILDTFIRCL